MMLTEEIQSLTRKTMSVVSLHGIMLIVFSIAHEEIDLMYQVSAYLFLLILLVTLPIVIVFLLSTRYARQGAIVLLGILMAELASNIFTRFSVLPMVVMEKPKLIWRIIYEGSFGLVLILEVIGCWLAIKVLQEVHKQIKPQSYNQPKEQKPL